MAKEPFIKELRTYAGRRLSKTHSVVYVWHSDDPRHGQTEYVGMDEQIAPAVVGSVWKFTVNLLRGIVTGGGLAPEFVEQRSGEQIIEWEAEDRVTISKILERKLQNGNTT